MNAAQEIERVYLLDRLPDLPLHAEALNIEQGYFPAPEGSEETFYEGRLRRTQYPDGRVRWVHTKKEGQGLVRREEERDLEREAFEEAWPRTAGRRLSKTRYRVREGARVWEVDAFSSLPLVMAEVELPTPEAEAPLPAWLAPHVLRELTWEPRYRNFALATLGLP